jgi:hypothetical protein
MEKAASFLDFLRSSQFLRTVVVTTSKEMDEKWLRPTHSLEDDLSREIFRAIAENPNIQTFTNNCYSVGFPPPAWTNLIAGTASISEMSLYPAKKYFPAEAFASNRSLVQLSITGYYDMLESVFFHLSFHPTLRKLTVQIGVHYHIQPTTHGLANMLRSNSTLENLAIHSIKLDTTTLGPVVSALESNSTLVCLGLSGSFEDDVTVKMMIEFVQNKCNRGTSRLKELRCPPRETRGTHRSIYFPGRYVGKPMNATMLVDSCLEILETDNENIGTGYSNSLEFFNELTENVSAIRLSDLRLRGVGNKDAMEALTRFLHLTTTLRHLSFDGPESELPYRERFLKAIRHNGSLHSFSLHEEFRLDENWWLERISFYCKRNKELPHLLGPLNQQDRKLTLFPSLFAVARPATRTATNAVFLGLLAYSGDAIGPLHRGKRARPC